MATTATLNGGPTGGLHTTPTLIHSEEPPPDETCRVESNSSFESGHEELQTALPLDQGETPSWACGGELDKSSESQSFFMDTHSTNSLLEAKGKKRRKQSRPIRIPASEFPDTGTTRRMGGTAIENLEAGAMPLPCLGHESDEHEGVQHPRKHPLKSHHVPLNLSKNEHLAFSDSQQEHIRQMCQDPMSLERLHSNNNSSIENDKTELAGQGTKDSFSTCNPINSSGSPPNPLPPSFSPGLFPLSSSSPFSALFPSAVGFFSQHQQLSSGMNHQQARSSTTPNPPSGTPTSSSSAGSNNLGGSSHQNVPPHRIFNPEAYCDLCNKEFCNKYFLKTHKANKHGVYSELPANLALSQSISSSPSSSYLATPVLSVLPALQQQQQSQQQTAQGQPLAAVPVSSASAAVSKGGGLAPGAEIPFSVGFSLEKSGNSNGSQRESFCELCQKEFCNKYFLKRHKAKIHGIPMESSSRSSSSGRSQRDTFSNGMSERRSLEGLPGSGMATLRDIKLESLGLELVAKHMDDSGGDGEDGRGEEGELAHSDESRNGMNLVNSGQCDLSAQGNAELKSPENAADLSDENSSFKISSLELKLPQLGVVSGENTCQFCFRDFSNKTLLRNHLVKKHRLLLPSFPPFLLPFGNIPTLFDEAGDAAPNLDNNGNSTEIDYECNLCNRSFQTIYLLRMHKSYFHPDSEEATDSASKLITEAAASLISGGLKSADEAEPGLASDPESGKNTPNGENNSKMRKGKNLSSVEMESRGEGTSDSDDLRRLQTMIMELNRVSSASVAAWSPPLEPNISPAPLSTNSSTVCHICSKEFYSSYFLQQHIQHYHSAAAGTTPDAAIQIKSESPSEMSNNNTNATTTGGAKKSSSGSTSGESRDLAQSIVPGALKERLLHASTSDSLAHELNAAGAGGANPFLAPVAKGQPPINAANTTINNNNAIKAESGGSSNAAANAKRPSPSLSRSYCTICHKELCNKYFMRTHMLKMHGISIESSTGLGGVTCDICNKELCSKYFLKVHKQNTHGIVEEGPSPPNPSTPGPIGLSASFPLVAASNNSGMNLSTGSAGIGEGNVPVSQADSVPLLPNNQLDLTNRYFCHYSEVCPFCGRRFRSAKWLKTHLIADHGQEGRERWKSIEKTLGGPSRRQSKIGGGGKGGSGSSKLSSSGSKSSSSHKNSATGRDANKCALCGFSTGDMEAMKVHLIKEHGNQLASGQAALVGDSAAFQDGQRGVVLDPLTMLFQKMEGGTNKMYRCAYCPFTTSLLVYLYAHERTHTGLANSVTSPASTSTQQQETSATFQCPMCFHTFQQAEAFQQHLIGHQMSGVLAPFFTPTTSASGRLAFLATPPGSDPTNDPAALLSLPLLNGNSGDNLYWALKNASNGNSNLENLKGGQKHSLGKEEESTAPTDEGMNEDLSPEIKPRKRARISHFRCSHCQLAFKSRDECAKHIQQTHNNNKQPKSRRKKSFRCRKCKFFSSTYHMLLVHSRLHHSILRDSRRGKVERSWKMENLPEGRGIPQEGVGDGEFVMQGFLLTSSEEESSNQSGYFVPSLVYLPVREKVSQSIRVSFSLTPTS